MNIFLSRLTYKYSSKGIKTTKKAKITKNGNFLKHPFKRAVPVLNRATSAHCHKSKLTLLGSYPLLVVVNIYKQKCHKIKVASKVQVVNIFSSSLKKTTKNMEPWQLNLGGLHVVCVLQVKKNITNLKFLRPKPRKSVLSRALKLALWDVTKCFLQEQNLIILHEIT